MNSVDAAYCYIVAWRVCVWYSGVMEHDDYSCGDQLTAISVDLPTT